MQKHWSFYTTTAFLMMVFVVLLVCSSFQEALAQTPKVGRRAAAKYFAADQNLEPRELETKRAPVRARQGDRFLMMSLGMFTGSKSYAWKGSGTIDNPGRWSYGITYLFEEWQGMDMNIRFDFNEYNLNDARATKLSLLPLVTFPEASSGFPLYFGAGAGLGVFFQQLPDESNLSFDYQLVAGARFMNLLDNGGFFFEFGMKNHLHLLSDGQFNGTALTTGAVFTF